VIPRPLALVETRFSHAATGRFITPMQVAQKVAQAARDYLSRESFRSPAAGFFGSRCPDDSLRPRLSAQPQMTAAGMARIAI